MCGIYATNILYDQPKVEEKLGLMKFRGPDHSGYLKKGNISLGHVRLAILDLDTRSNQPYCFDEFTIVYNGEIYNFIEIKEELESLGIAFHTTSDTEVLLKAYSVWGTDCISKLNGMFAFAILDSKKDELFCARDRVGVKPFYYYWNDGIFEICSQLRPLVNKETSTISEEAVSIYLDCGYVPSPFSILENVYKLPPGNYMILDLKKGTKNIAEYWNLQKVVPTKETYEEAKNKLHQLLKDAVKIRMRADVPLGSFLSGGVDSALVSAIAQESTKSDVNTFTIGFDDPKYDESKLAKQFSSIIGTNHTETTCGPDEVLQMLPKLVAVYDEPFADSSALPSLLLNSVTKQYVTVALSGDGGDESFLGYGHYNKLAKFNKIAWLPLFIRKGLTKINFKKLNVTRPDIKKGILQTKDADEFAWNVFTGFDTLQKKRKTDWFKYYQDYKKWSDHQFQRMADLNIKLWLENDSNVKVDRASMAFATEIRSPFLDYRIIEYARTLPISYRFKNGVKKYILKDILSEYIPKEVFDVPKSGFSIPLGSWIRKELKKEIENALTDDFLAAVPNLDIKKFKLQMYMHMQHKYDYAFNIWKLFILAKWMEKYGFKKEILI